MSEQQPSPSDVLAMTEDELLEIIGDNVIQQRRSARAPSKAEKLNAARIWLSGKSAELVRLLCGNKKIRELASKHSTEDKEAMVLLIGDLVTTVAGGIPVIYVSGLIIKQGVQALCHIQWGLHP